MTKKDKNVFNRLISKFSDLFKKSISNNPEVKEQKQNQGRGKATSLIVSKKLQPDEKILPEEILEKKDAEQAKVSEEIKVEINSASHNFLKDDFKDGSKVKGKTIKKYQPVKLLSNSDAKDNVDNLKTHVKIEPKEYMALEHKITNSIKSKSKQENTDKLEKSTIDIPQTHTVVNPKEYLESEFKLKEIRQSSKKSAIKRTKVSTSKDRMKSEFKKSTILKDELLVRANKTLTLKESSEKTEAKFSQNDSKIENRVQEPNSKTNQQIDSKIKKNESTEKIEQTDSMNLQEIHKEFEATNSIEIENNKPIKLLEKGDLESKLKIEQENTIKNASEDNILLEEDFNLEDSVEMDIEEDEILVEYSTDDEYENIINYKESLHQYEEEIENYDDYDDFDLEDLFSDQEFQQELSEVTYSNTNDYTENTQVIQKYQENPNNRQIFSDIVEKNQPLVKKVVQRYLGAATNTCLTYDDLVSAGNIGMLKAIEKFDPSSGFQFSTYATYWIAQGITRTIADEGRMIHLPVHQVDNILKLTKIENKMVREQAVIDDNRIMTEMEINRKRLDDLRYLRDTYKVVASIDIPIGDGEGSTLGQFLTPNQLVYSGHQTYLKSPSDKVEDEVFSEELIEWMTTKLTEQELDIVIRRNGLQGKERETLKAIGIDYGVTRERIRQIEEKAYKKLRRTIKSFLKID
ncbi:sigma-70 family RNA polymerase sigma factor [Aerococcus urinaeequi]|uniref:sigma-70 family RNA polymerase sigma factor n=1 Tax=Aerococcus urinaeequi TaxID=51665 RepID=UPI003D6ADFDA